MLPTRTVLLVALVAGCGKPDPAPPPAAKPAPTLPPPAAPATAAVPPKTVAPTGPPPVVQATGPSVDPADRAKATAAAGQFLAGLAAGTPDLAAVTPEFKTVLAGGDAGRADWAAEQYLRGLAGKVSAAGATVLDLPPGLVATAPPTPTAGRPLVRLVKAGDRWQVSWVHVGPAAAPELGGPPAELGPKVAAACFVEAVLGSQFRLAEAALSPAGRGRVAPPLGNDPLGFSRGTLSNKLKGFAGGATGYTLQPAAGGSVGGELTGPGNGRRAFRLTVGAGPRGPVVDDFEPR